MNDMPAFLRRKGKPRVAPPAMPTPAEAREIERRQIVADVRAVQARYAASLLEEDKPNENW